LGRALAATAGTLCVLVAAYAILLACAPSLRPPLMQQRFSQYPVSTWLHLTIGALVIVLAPFQLSARARERFPRAHRWGGRAYAVGVLVSGSAGLALARVSQGGGVAHVGFGTLAVLWIATTALGVQRIRRGDREGHERWMLRSVALTFAAVTLRLYIPLGVVLGLPVEPSYRAIAWLCWLPNLLVVEWALHRPQGGRRRVGRPVMWRERITPGA
jgi:uncharacterized membrane protein YozB (DUF420 family)